MPNGKKLYINFKQGNVGTVAKNNAYSIFEDQSLKELKKAELEKWQKAELMDNIKSLIFHDRLTDKQKIISLKMLLEDE